MWELDCEEGWAPKNWCFWTVMLEKTPESPLDCKEIQPVHSEGDQPWDFFGRNYAKAETSVLWPPHAKSWLIGKDSDAGRDWGQEEKGTIEDEMAGWHHWFNGRESEWTRGVGDGQGGLACCDLWGCKESDTTERLNWWLGLDWRTSARKYGGTWGQAHVWRPGIVEELGQMQRLKKHQWAEVSGLSWAEYFFRRKSIMMVLQNWQFWNCFFEDEEKCEILTNAVKLWLGYWSCLVAKLCLTLLQPHGL